MTYASETIDRRERTQTIAEELPRHDIWMETNLPWNPRFWERLSAMTLMRLNPHWHIEKAENKTYSVEDVLVESEFSITPELEMSTGIFTATFTEIGLKLSARPSDNKRNTDFRFSCSTEKGCTLTGEDIARTMQYWLPSLREYYRLHEADSLKHRCWRFFMDKVMLTMNPTQRRICGFMFKLTVLECLLIVILGVGWFYYGA